MNCRVQSFRNIQEVGGWVAGSAVDPWKDAAPFAGESFRDADLVLLFSSVLRERSLIRM